VLEKLEAQLHDIEPLFTENDYYLYDNYSDGDPYDDPDYIRNFKTVLEAVHRRKTIKVSYSSRFGRRKFFYCKVRKIEYSQKDDKFRIFSKVKNRHTILNLARINACELVDANDDKKLQNTGSHELEFGGKRTKASVTLEIYDDRKAMERVMLAFAHFEKSAVQVDETTYRLTLTYDSFDETELVVRTLSFGPMVKVLEPTGFRDLIKARIARQMELMEANRKHTRT